MTLTDLTDLHSPFSWHDRLGSPRKFGMTAQIKIGMLGLEVAAGMGIGIGPWALVHAAVVRRTAPSRSDSDLRSDGTVLL
jgi:hypothetical protein